MQLDLDAEGLLLDGRDARGEGLPHAGGAAQGQLRAALQARDGAGQHRRPAGATHKQATDVLPVGEKREREREREGEEGGRKDKTDRERERESES